MLYAMAVAIPGTSRQGRYRGRDTSESLIRCRIPKVVYRYCCWKNGANVPFFVDSKYQGRNDLEAPRSDDKVGRCNAQRDLSRVLQVPLTKYLPQIGSSWIRNTASNSR